MSRSSAASKPSSAASSRFAGLAAIAELPFLAATRDALPWSFAGLAVGLVAFYLWGLSGLPGFGDYPGPYGFIINRIAVGQTNATGVVSTINFDYRGFDTVGEEFILFAAAAGPVTTSRASLVLPAR